MYAYENISKRKVNNCFNQGWDLAFFKPFLIHDNILSPIFSFADTEYVPDDSTYTGHSENYDISVGFLGPTEVFRKNSILSLSSSLLSLYGHWFSSSKYAFLVTEE